MNWFFLWLSFFSLFALGLADNARGPVYPDLLRDFALNDSQGALFFFVTSACGLANNLAYRWWLPRMGAFRALQVYLFIQGTGLVLMGMSRAYGMMLVGAALFGAGMGGLGIAQNVLVGRASAPEFQRQAYSALHCTYGAASLIAPLVVSGLYHAGFAWPSAFLATASASGLLLLVSFIGRGRKVVGEEATVPSRRVGSAFKSIVWVCATVVSYVIAEILVCTRYVLLARREFGASLESANRQLSLFFALLFLGRLVFVLVPMRIPALRLMAASALSSAVLCALGLIVDPIWMALSGFTMAPFFPAAMAYIQGEFGADADNAVSWVLTIDSLGLMFMHALVGWMSDLVGLRLAMGWAPGCLILALVGLALRGKFAPRAVTQA